MKFLTRRILIIPFVFMLQSCGGGGGSLPAPSTPLATTTSVASVERILAKGIDAGLDALLVHVLQADGSVIEAAAGIQDKASGEPADPRALFKIASVSKLYIAVAATKMTYQDLISLDDSLALWLPDVAAHIENSDRITLRHLVQHRSGIPDFVAAQGFSWANMHTDIDGALALVLDKPADFSPNSRYAYSNTNYLLLGKVLDRALGYSHLTFIQDFILTPLGLQDTYNLPGDIDRSRLVKGYWGNRDVTDQDYIIAGGSMVATLADVAVFLRSLVSGDLLNKEERAIYRGVYQDSHSGWLPGYQGYANYEKSLDAVIVLFLNTTGGNSEELLESTYLDILRALR